MDTSANGIYLRREMQIEVLSKTNGEDMMELTEEWNKQKVNAIRRTILEMLNHKKEKFSYFLYWPNILASLYDAGFKANNQN